MQHHAQPEPSLKVLNHFSLCPHLHISIYLPIFLRDLHDPEYILALQPPATQLLLVSLHLCPYHPPALASLLTQNSLWLCLPAPQPPPPGRLPDLWLTHPTLPLLRLSSALPAEHGTCLVTCMLCSVIEALSPQPVTARGQSLLLCAHQDKRHSAWGSRQVRQQLLKDSFILAQYGSRCSTDNELNSWPFRILAASSGLPKHLFPFHSSSYSALIDLFLVAPFRL